MAANRTTAMATDFIVWQMPNDLDSLHCRFRNSKSP
jgi:hypothetical protein